MPYVAEIFYLLRDIVLAVLHALIGKRRVAYAVRADVRAPRDIVWRLIDADEVTYEASGLHVRLEPIDGIRDGHVGHMSVRGKPLGRLGYQKLKVEPLCTHISRYLPEHSDLPQQLGDDDLITILLEDAPKGGTRLGVARELTHKTFSTRITAPVGVRQAAWMIEKQAEKDAGVVEGGGGGAWRQAVTALVAFGSFAWIVGWQDALILMVIIAVHEGGHALAMLWYRLGIAFVGFVPFLGGMASPARSYDSDWQHGIVALAGVGVSLPVALGLSQLAEVNSSVVIAHAAVLFAFVNGANLLPLPGLDGGMVTRLLSHRIHPAFAHVVMWAMMVAFVALGAYLGSAWVWLAVAFGFLQLVIVSSFKPPATRTPLSWGGAVVLLVLYCGLMAAYVAIGIATLRQEQRLEREDRAGLGTGTLVASSGAARISASLIRFAAEPSRTS